MSHLQLPDDIPDACLDAYLLDVPIFSARWIDAHPEISATLKTRGGKSWRLREVLAALQFSAEFCGGNPWAALALRWGVGQNSIKQRAFRFAKCHNASELPGRRKKMRRNRKNNLQKVSN